MLRLDPKGADNCDVCARPDREQIDVDLLTSEELAPVAENYRFGQRVPDVKFGGPDFVRVCALLERHRRLHVLRVFESIEQDDDLPDNSAPSVRYSEWLIRKIYDEYRAADDIKDRLAALSLMGKSIVSRATLRGELEAGKKRSAEAIETEAVLSPEQKQRIIEAEARKLGLKLIPIQAAPVPAVRETGAN